jgi:hypothetical protein
MALLALKLVAPLAMVVVNPLAALNVNAGWFPGEGALQAVQQSIPYSERPFLSAISWRWA